MNIKVLKLILIILFFGCSSNNYEDYFRIPIQKSLILIDKIELDTISLEKINSSYIGNVSVYDNTIYFVDEEFCFVYSFNLNGELKDKFLGSGRGPNEISTNNIVGHENYDGKFIFIGASNDFHLFDENFNKINSYVMNNRYKRLTEKKETLDMPYVYTVSYPNLKIRCHESYIYFNIYCEHPKLNFYNDPINYFKNSRVLSKMNINNGVVEEILGRYSPVYSEFENKKQFSLTIFDISKEGLFFVSQEADSIIYCYNNNYEIKYAFGLPGKDMNIEYNNLNTVDEFKNSYLSERREFGYYNDLEYIDERKMLFRSYKKGIHKNVDGLQIYNDGILIGDVEVPLNFKVVGYSNSYFYSEAMIDEFNEVIHLFRFKLDLDEI